VGLFKAKAVDEVDTYCNSPTEKFTQPVDGRHQNNPTARNHFTKNFQEILRQLFRSLLQGTFLHFSYIWIYVILFLCINICIYRIPSCLFFSAFSRGHFCTFPIYTHTHTHGNGHGHGHGHAPTLPGNGDMGEGRGVGRGDVHDTRRKPV
jgi:hypothetical protein